VIGLTATPQRTDGKGLDDLFDCIVKGPSIRWLMEQGYLSDYEIYAPKLVQDLSSIKISMGDFSKSDAEKVIDKPKITGDAVDHYLKIAKGKRCVVMCVTIKHAEHVCEQYIASGVAAAQIDGVMTTADRQKVLADFAAGKILVICNVQLLIEGVDIPSIEVVQWLRPTQSLIVFMQGNGRGLRPSDGKEKLIVLDHVGNVERHGMLCDDREWSLEGRKAGKRKKKDEEPDVNIQQCKHCYAVFRPGPENCPYCGKPIEKKAARQLEEVDGELVKIDMERFRKEQRKEQGSARTLRDLVALGMRRGMAKASQWAAITCAAREQRKPTPADFNEARRIQQELTR
jgi:superfamily II DNA or RNA helicase